MQFHDRTGFSLATSMHPEIHTGSLPTMDSAAALRAVGAFCQALFPSAAAATDAALELVMRFVGVRTAFITQVSDRTLNILDAHDNQGCGIAIGGVVPLETAYCQYVRAANAPVIIPDAAHDPRVQQLASRTDLSMAAYIGVPLHRADGSLYGTLCAVDPEPRPLDETHAALMQVVAQRVSSLLEHEQISAVVLRAEQDAEQDLAAALELLDQQTIVLRTVAHDLRTPLSGVRGYVDLLNEGIFGPVPLEQRDVLKRVQDSAQWMNRLINDIVDVASIETQTFTLLTTAYQPDALAQKVIDGCHLLSADRNLSLRLTHDQNLPTVVGDADRVQQILFNLISNAIRYTRHGSVELAVCTHEDGIEFRVTDTGPGISDEVRAHIWERHTRASGQGRGLGLGLYVVQRLTTAMGGTAGVDSTLGQGSSFWVRLPLYATPPHYEAW